MLLQFTGILNDPDSMSQRWIKIFLSEVCQNCPSNHDSRAYIYLDTVCTCYKDCTYMISDRWGEVTFHTIPHTKLKQNSNTWHAHRLCFCILVKNLTHFPQLCVKNGSASSRIIGIRNSCSPWCWNTGVRALPPGLSSGHPPRASSTAVIFLMTVFESRWLLRIKRRSFGEFNFIQFNSKFDI